MACTRQPCGTVTPTKRFFVSYLLGLTFTTGVFAGSIQSDIQHDLIETYRRVADTQLDAAGGFPNGTFDHASDAASL